MNELNECVVESIIVDDWITGSEKRGSSFVHIDGERTCKESSHIFYVFILSNDWLFVHM